MFQVSGLSAIQGLCLPVGIASDFMLDFVSDTLRMVMISHACGAPAGTIRRFIYFTSSLCVFVCLKQPFDVCVYIRQLDYLYCLYIVCVFSMYVCM